MGWCVRSQTRRSTYISTSMSCGDEVVVALDWTPNTNHTGFFVAKAQGLYAAAGLKVRLLGCHEPDFRGSYSEDNGTNPDGAFPTPCSKVAAKTASTLWPPRFLTNSVRFLAQQPSPILAQRPALYHRCSLSNIWDTCGEKRVETTISGHLHHRYISQKPKNPKP